MAVVRCEKGHFYDDIRYPSCPHCQISGDASAGAVTQHGAEKLRRTAVEQRLINLTPQADEKTIGIFKKKHGWDPVTGWLVCVSGPEKGRDYRLHAGRNFLGRAPQMDISVADDQEISREHHCSVVYDPKSRAFLLAPGSSNTYLNGRAITEAAALKASDVIGAGASEFVFIPFCGDERSW